MIGSGRYKDNMAPRDSRGDESCGGAVVPAGRAGPGRAQQGWFHLTVTGKRLAGPGSGLR